jgi:hypothetical protein
VLSEHFEEVVPADSFLLAVGQRLLEEVVGARGEGVPFEYVGDGDGFDALQQLVFVSGLPGGEAEYHFVEDDSQRPDVALCGVLDAL